MLDIRFIRENVDQVRRAIEVKRIACDLDRLLAVDARRRAIQQETDTLRAKSNELSGQVGLYKNPKSKWFQQAIASGCFEAELKAEGDRIAAESGRIKQRVRELEDEAKTVAVEFDALMLTVPQVPSAKTPIGPDASGNV